MRKRAAEPQTGPPQTPYPIGQTGTLGLLVRRIDRTQYLGCAVESIVVTIAFAVNKQLYIYLFF